jgi:MFS family permease
MMALSFASLGTGVGAMCIPLLLQFCIDNFGWRGSILIMGGLALNLPVCGMTYAEVKSRKSGTASTQKPLINITECLKVLMTNGLFVWFVVAMAMVTSVLNIVSIFLIDYLQSRGMTREEAVNVYFIMTITATVFRLVPGILKQIPGISVTVFPVMFASIGCVALALLPLFKTRLTLIFVACVYGCSLGGVVTVNSIVVLKLINREHYSTAIGINGALSGLSSIAAGPIAGELICILYLL